MQPIFRFRLFLVISIVLVLASKGFGETQSVEATMDGLVQRLCDTLPEKELFSLTEEKIQATLTPEERESLATRHVTLEVNVPVVISVMRHVDQPVVPFWLPEAGFKKTDLKVVNEENWEYEVWQKNFDPGSVGLGINGFGNHRPHYFVTVGPVNQEDHLEITHLHPSEFPVVWMHRGAYVYNDWDSLLLKEVPQELVGHRLLTTIRGRARAAHLIGGFRKTRHPSRPAPDQIFLTWSEDPKTTQTVQWRTSTELNDGAVRYKKKGSETYREVPAITKKIDDRFLVNDPHCHHYTAVIKPLEPGTSYIYQVGHPKRNLWSEESEFTTAPAEPEPYTFVSFGDTHNRDLWGEMLQVVQERHPEIAFYTIAGDLVDTGQFRNDWDRFFDCTRDIGRKLSLIPTIGNHDVLDGLGAQMYLDMFALPQDGPDTIEKERAYSTRYSNTEFLVLDSTLPARDQAQWLEDQLAKSESTWKFATYHFPPYNEEDPYPGIRDLWGYLFDKYHLDIALEGHVHYYMRSHPIYRGAPVDSPSRGTIHIVSIPIGNRPRDLPSADYVATQFAGIPVYQLFEINGNELNYTVYDLDGNTLDHFSIRKEQG